MCQGNDCKILRRSKGERLGLGIQSKKGLVFWFDRHPFVTVFLLCAGLSALVFLPSVIRGGGMLTVVSDFNHQQIVFHLFSNQSVKNGEMLWDWYTDLGGSFIGNYGFYTLGSLFFLAVLSLSVVGGSVSHGPSSGVKVRDGRLDGFCLYPPVCEAERAGRISGPFLYVFGISGYESPV